jgi:hypothetical protein
MSFYESILGFVTDKSKTPSTRATFTILILCGILLVDNITGFSYYFNKQRQLEQLQSISILLKDSTLSPKIHERLIQLETQIFERKSILDYSIGFLKNIFSNSGQIPIDSARKTRSNFWFLISSSGFYILVTIFIAPIMLFLNKKSSLLTRLATILIFSTVMFFTSWFFYWLMDKLIPDRLFGSWIWNYVINFIAQISLIIGLYWSTKIINKTNQ